MKSFKLRILSAEHVFFEGECESLVVPTTQGQYGILAGHSNMAAAIVPGILLIRVPGGKLKPAAVSEGLVRVENGEVLVIADTVERPEDIDENRAKQNADRAKEELMHKKSYLEYRAAQATLARAVSRLRVKRRDISQ